MISKSFSQRVNEKVSNTLRYFKKKIMNLFKLEEEGNYFYKSVKFKGMIESKYIEYESDGDGN